MIFGRGIEGQFRMASHNVRVLSKYASTSGHLLVSASTYLVFFIKFRKVYNFFIKVDFAKLKQHPTKNTSKTMNGKVDQLRFTHFNSENSNNS